MSQGLSSQAASSVVRSLLASPNDPSLYSEVKITHIRRLMMPVVSVRRRCVFLECKQAVTMLQEEQARRKVEFYALVDADKKVIASSNAIHVSQSSLTGHLPGSARDTRAVFPQNLFSTSSCPCRLMHADHRQCLRSLSYCQQDHHVSKVHASVSMTSRRPPGINDGWSQCKRLAYPNDSLIVFLWITAITRSSS